MVAVVGRCLVGCEHCEGYCSTHDAQSQKPKALFLIFNLMLAALPSRNM